MAGAVAHCYSDHDRKSNVGPTFDEGNLYHRGVAVRAIADVMKRENCENSIHKFPCRHEEEGEEQESCEYVVRDCRRVLQLDELVDYLKAKDDKDGCFVYLHKAVVCVDQGTSKHVSIHKKLSK